MDALPFGIDFGGSGIKGAPVDLEPGDFAADRVRIKTPQPSTPEAVADVFVELLGRFPDSTGPVGVTVPASSGTGSSTRPPTSTAPGSAPTPTPCSPPPRVATYTSSTTRTPQVWPRCGTARRRGAVAW